MAQAGRDWSWIAWIGLAGVVGLGWFAFHRGEGQPVRLASDVEGRAARTLSQSGYSWARLDVKGPVGELHGVAPSEDARNGAFDAARKALAPYMGVPGVFSELENRVRVQAPPPRAAAPIQVTAATVQSEGAADAEPESLAPARACLDALGSTMRNAPIRFKPRASELPAAARPAVRRLVQVVNRCDGWRLVIEGHPDRGGGRAANRRLVQRRAVAVASALLLEGIPVSRLALQTDDDRLHTPGVTVNPAAEFNDRITYQLVPPGTALD